MKMIAPERRKKARKWKSLEPQVAIALNILMQVTQFKEIPN
jgi:hypothetical protein